MNKKLNIAIIGQKFMGRAHSNGWKQAQNFFSLNAEPVLKVACGRNETELKKFADRWGWSEISSDWKSVIERDDIDIVDIESDDNKTLLSRYSIASNDPTRLFS